MLPSNRAEKGMTMGIARRIGVGAVLAGCVVGGLAAPPAQAVVPKLASGPGWTFVTVRDEPTERLLLVAGDPAGHQRTLMTVPAGMSLADVSRDGRYLLLSGTEKAPHGMQIFVVLDVTTATSTSAHRVAGTLIRFANAKGTALVALREGAPALRIDHRGRVLGSYQATLDPDRYSSLPLADGRGLVATDARARMVLLDVATGKLLRTYQTPKGYDVCWPQNLVGSTQFATTCLADRASYDRLHFYNSDVYIWSARSSTGSGRTNRLVRVKNEAGYLNGYLSLWTTPAGTMLSADDIHCADTWMGFATSSGVRKASWWRPGSTVFGVQGSSVYLRQELGRQCNYGNTQMVRVDVRTGRSTVVVSPGKGQSLVGLPMIAGGR